jgi:hypothetical protein
MEGQSGPAPGGVASGAVKPGKRAAPSRAERRAKRILIAGLIAAAAILVTLVVVLICLAIGAYKGAQAGADPNPEAIIIGILRDLAIVIVAFETLMIGVLLIVLVLLVASLVLLFRDEIGPALEAANETLATVRGTTNFVSHKVVSPLLKWSGYVAGVRRILRALAGLREGEE